MTRTIGLYCNFWALLYASASHFIFKLCAGHLMLFMDSKDSITSASAITNTLSGELADGQRQLLAIAASGANSKAINPLVTQLNNGPLAGLHEMVHAYKLLSLPLYSFLALGLLTFRGSFLCRLRHLWIQL